MVLDKDIDKNQKTVTREKIISFGHNQGNNQLWKGANKDKNPKEYKGNRNKNYKARL